ncbi:MAG: hypothetical protein CBR30_03570 [Dictyoglomus sp. NZ13-RE01]|nr:MAG: hypothetical protein CBR30_03570 [Dictyoglomus sp. NZ13-RE01]
MDLSNFLLAFLTIFLAELGDKTQLAVISLSVKTKSPLAIFLGASLALSLLSFLGAYLGDFLVRYILRDLIEKIAGLLFIIIGIFMIIKKN